MAEIEIERKRGNPWTWALVMILLLLVVGTVWYLGAVPGGGGPIRTDVDTQEQPGAMPPGTPPTARP